VTDLEAIPLDWQRGIIVPIYKSGSVHDIDNYRGITLKSLSKVNNDSKNYCDSELQSLKEMVESNTKVLNTELNMCSYFTGIDHSC
jgi:hypothetical protein